MDCDICYETVTEDKLQILECAHALCKSCLSKLRNRNCPFCRNPISSMTQQREETLETLSIRIVDEQEVERYDIDIHNSLQRFNRRRRRDREERERIRDEIFRNIPREMSEHETQSILTQFNNARINNTLVTMSPISVPDRAKQKHRHERNRYKNNRHNTNIIS